MVKAKPRRKSRTKKKETHFRSGLVFGGMCLAIISLLFFYKIAHSEPAISPTDHFALGQYYFNVENDSHGHYDLAKARTEYSAALAEESTTNPMLWYQLGRIDFLEGRYISALYKFNKQIEYFGDEIPNVHYMLGLTFAYKAEQSNDVAEWQNAENSFKKYLEFDSESPWAHVDLSWVYFSQGKYEEMVPVLEEALLKNPDHPWLLNMYGLALLNTERKQEAEEVFEHAGREANKLTRDDWGRAYPGNNPAEWQQGLDSFRQAIRQNILLVVSGDVVSGMHYGENAQSVEIGLAELSPRGEAGGYAVPASGGSHTSAPPVPGVITLVMSPPEIKLGESAEISWKWSRATGLGLEHVSVERCKTPGSNTTNCSSWVNVLNIDGKKFGAGRTDFTCFLILTCHDVIEKGASPTYDAKIGSLTPGKYTYRAIGKFFTGDQTSSATIEVQGSIANLMSEGVGLTSESSLEDNTALFAAQIKNNGSASTKKSFTNTFEYRWGDDGGWIALGTPTSPVLMQGGAVVVTSNSVTLKKTGSLQVRVCADSKSAIPESDESDNCATPSVFNMSTLFPGLVPLQLERTSGDIGEKITFSGLILNAGSGASSPSSARFCIDNDECATSATGAIGSPAIPKLLAGDVSGTLSARWTASGGDHSLYFCVVEGACLSLPFTINDIDDTADAADTPGVGAQLSVSLTAADTLVRKGEFTELIWDAGNSTCVLVGTNGLSKQNLQGSGTVSSGIITQKSVFTLRCLRNGSMVTAPPVTINVVPEIKEI